MHTLEQLKSGQLLGQKRVSIRENLSEFPRELFSLADTLEVLDLSENQLSTLPKDFGRLTHLKAVFFFDNRFEQLPAELNACPHLSVFGFRNNTIRDIELSALPARLRWLILTGNKIKHLRGDMSHLTQLQKCMLAGNQLEALPASMQRCKKLELLRISSNQLTELPAWILTMPRLSWLAYAGNPFNASSRAHAESITSIHWQNLKIEEALGQGASGIVYKARWQTKAHSKDVAVKVFKSGMTSDGSPLDERDASVAIGAHKNAVSVIAEITAHPEGKDGLVFELIPPEFKNMSGPPSLSTCTRDTYAHSLRFHLKVLLNIAKGMARFALHCHQHGVLHGDLYPHNTLVNDEGRSLVSDFGAATRFDNANTPLAEGLEKMEVRAWACALDDMLVRLHEADRHENSDTLAELHALQRRCFDERPANRPDFQQVLSALDAL